MDGERGPCGDCMHAREGTSTALAVFDQVPAALQPAVRSAQLQKAREEPPIVTGICWCCIPDAEEEQ